MTFDQSRALSDGAIVYEADRAAAATRHSNVVLLMLLAEVERRDLHLALGYSSLFSFCTRRLKLSEASAYGRITAARLARRFPEVLDLVGEGALTLSGISRLAGHVTAENAECVFDAAKFKSTRDIEQLVASLTPQPDVPSCLRALPLAPVASASGAVALRPVVPIDAVAADAPASADSRAGCPARIEQNIVSQPAARRRPALVAPLGTARHLLKITIGDKARGHLERLRDLMRHRIPDGDPAAIVEAALEELLARVERERLGNVRTPRHAGPSAGADRRRIPAGVRRAVWARDGGRCAFVGRDGRCGSAAFLELHHVKPVASGGQPTVDNLELRCRAHNGHEARRWFDEQRQ
jgi:hypothetical protein